MINDKVVPGDSTRLSMKADKRAGELIVTRPPPGSAPEVQWRDRATGAPIWQRMVFPGDISFRRIMTPNANDRVYELRFVASGARTFFFMQDADAVKDGDRVRDLLAAVENPTTFAQAQDRAAALVRAGEEGTGSALNMGGVLSAARGGARPVEFDLSSILGGMAPSPANVSGFTGAASSGLAASAPPPLLPGSGAPSALTPAAAAAAGGAAAPQPPPSAVAADNGSMPNLVGDEEMDEELRMAIALSMVDDEVKASTGGGAGAGSSSSSAGASSGGAAGGGGGAAAPPPSEQGSSSSSSSSSSSGSTAAAPPASSGNPDTGGGGGASEQPDKPPQ